MQNYQTLQGVIGASLFLDSVARVSTRCNHLTEFPIMHELSGKNTRKTYDKVIPKTPDKIPTQSFIGFRDNHGMRYNREDHITEFANPSLADGDIRARHYEQRATSTERLTIQFPPISPLLAYCSKTGQPCGQHDEGALRRAHEMHGAEYTEQFMYAVNTLGVHPLWLQCDSATLDQLQDKDPRGYAVYCFALITQRFNASKENAHLVKQEIGRIGTERYWSLARAFAILSLLHGPDLASLNANLARVLTYAPDTIRYLGRVLGKRATAPDALAILAVQGVLPQAIEQSIAATLSSIAAYRHAIREARTWNGERWVYSKPLYETKPKTIADARRGPSQIKGQRKVKLDAEELDLLDAINQAWGDNIPEAQDARAEGAAWRKRIAANQALANAEPQSMEDLDLELSLEALFDENTSIVRVAPEHVMREHAAFKAAQHGGEAGTPEHAPIIAPPVMLTLAQRIAANRARLAQPQPEPKTQEPARKLPAFLQRRKEQGL